MRPGFGAELRALHGALAPATRRRLVELALLMPIAGLAEAAMVAAMVVFLALLAGPEAAALDSGWIQALLEPIEEITPRRMLLGSIGLFALLALTAAGIRLALVRLTQRFAFGAGHELATEIHRRLLHQPYLLHLGRHSSERLALLDKVDHLVFHLLLQAIQAFSALMIGSLIFLFLVSLDPLAASLAILLLGGLYGLALVIVRQLIRSRAELINTAYDQRLHTLQESLGGVRDIILEHSQPVHVERFRRVDNQLAQARAESAFLASAPRIAVESIGLILIAFLAAAVADRTGGLVTVLPLLGGIALGAQRMLPLLSQLYAGWASFASSAPMVKELADLLALPVPHEPPREPLALATAVTFKDVSFRYPDRGDPAVHHLNLTIDKGALVAVTGRTGSGKSTLADLLMGLIEPDAGEVLIDGEPLVGDRLARWRQAVAHVPQTIFLADASIAANIALGELDAPRDMDRVRRAAEIAQLADFVATLPHGYDTHVGERGVLLSGGQRQRLALARALYKQAQLLVLDEATSALDERTEAAVLAALHQLHAQGCTIVVIAHRLSTVEQCNPVFVLEEGRLIRSGSFAQLFGELSRLKDAGEL